MVVTDFRAHTNLLVFTEDMVLFWTAGLFNDGVYIHPAPYKEKFLSHIYVKGVGYFYYYQSPRGTESDRVWLGEIKLTPENQLHTAPGYDFTGDRKEKRLMVLNGEGREIGRYRGTVDDVAIGSEPIRFTCYLDHSLLEVYVNEVKSVSVRNFFPERSFQVLSYVNQLKLWELEAAL